MVNSSSFDFNSYYFNGLSNVSLLSENQEQELILDSSNGNANARDKLVLSNIRFVYSIAKNYYNKGVPNEDIIQAGIFGLILAANKVNPEYNNHFITYAAWYIKNEIQQELRVCSKGVKLPARNPAEAVNSRWNFADLDKVINVTGLECSEISEFNKNQVSVPADEKVMKEELLEKLQWAIDQLPELQRQAILDYFGFNGEALSYSQIGAKLGYTRQGINAIVNRALENLKKYLMYYYEEEDLCGLAA